MSRSSICFLIGVIVINSIVTGCGGALSHELKVSSQLNDRVKRTQAISPDLIQTSSDNIIIGLGNEQMLVIQVAPEDSSNNVIYTSSNPDIATINSDGKISAKAIGKTRITVTSKWNPLVLSDVAVTVTATFESEGVDTEVKKWVESGVSFQVPTHKQILVNKKNKIKYHYNNLTVGIFSGIKDKYKGKSLEEIKAIKLNRFKKRGYEILGQEGFVIQDKKAVMLKVKRKKSMFCNVFFFEETAEGDMLFTNLKIMGGNDKEERIKTTIDAYINSIKK